MPIYNLLYLNKLSILAASSLGKVLPNTNILNFSAGENLNEEDKFKKVLIVPFENSFNSSIGLLPEHKVLEIEKLNSEEEGDQNNKPYETTKKKEKPLHSVSHEGSIGKN